MHLFSPKALTKIAYGCIICTFDEYLFRNYIPKGDYYTYD